MRTNRFGDQNSTGTALAISPCETMLFTAGYDNQLYFWSLPQGKLLATRDGHKRKIKSFAVSGDGNRLASGDFDGTIRIWDLPSMACQSEWTGHSDAVVQLRLSGDGTMLAAGDMTGCVSLWDVRTASNVGTIPGRGPRAHSKELALSASGDLMVMAYASDHRIYYWNPGHPEIPRLEAKGGSVTYLSINTIGTVVAAVSGHFAELWSLPDGRRIREFNLKNDGRVGITADDRYLVVADGRRFQLFALPSCEERIVLDEDERQHAVAFELDSRGTALAGVRSSGGNYSVRVWSLSDFRVLHEIQGISSVTGVMHAGKLLLRSGGGMRDGGENGLELIELET